MKFLFWRSCAHPLNGAFCGPGSHMLVEIYVVKDKSVNRKKGVDLFRILVSLFTSSLLKILSKNMTRRRQWQPTPVLLPGKSHGWRSLVGCSPWACEVEHDWATWLSLFTFMHWRRKWQPTPVLAWRIPGMGEPSGLPSMGSHRVGHDWSDLAA